MGRPTTLQKLEEQKTFKGSARSYPSHVMGGIILAAGTVVYEDFFSLSATSTSALAKILTNLTNPGKLGNNEAFDILAVAPRFQKVTDGVATPEEVEKITHFLNSSRLEMFAGDNQTKILDLQLSRFSSIISATMHPVSASGSTSESLSTTLPVNAASWLTFPSLAGTEYLEPNINISARLTCGLTSGTPSGIGTVASPVWVMQWIAEGVRYVKG